MSYLATIIMVACMSKVSSFCVPRAPLSSIATGRTLSVGVGAQPLYSTRDVFETFEDVPATKLKNGDDISGTRLHVTVNFTQFVVPGITGVVTLQPNGSCLFGDGIVGEGLGKWRIENDDQTKDDYLQIIHPLDIVYKRIFEVDTGVIYWRGKIEAPVKEEGEDEDGGARRRGRKKGPAYMNADSTTFAVCEEDGYSWLDDNSPYRMRISDGKMISEKENKGLLGLGIMKGDSMFINEGTFTAFSLSASEPNPIFPPKDKIVPIYRRRIAGLEELPGEEDKPKPSIKSGVKKPSTSSGEDGPGGGLGLKKKRRRKKRVLVRATDVEGGEGFAPVQDKKPKRKD